MVAREGSRIATPFYIGTDFGATKIRAGVVSADGRILGRAEVPTGAPGGVAAVLANLERAFRAACAAAGGLDLAAAAGLGVAAPGQVDKNTLAIIHGPNLDWHDVPFGAMLRDRFGSVPIAVENDVNAAALGEYKVGAGRGIRDLAVIFVGTGIGGGIIAGGELVDGVTGAAGEVGHMVYRPDGEMCGCGGRGHFEAYAGGAPVERRFRDRVRAGLATVALELAGGTIEAIDLGTIFEGARRGDPPCVEVTAELERALGILAASVATLLNPARIVLGGGIVKKNPDLVAKVGAAVGTLASVAAARACEVVASALFEDAAVLGSVEAVKMRAR